MAKSKATIKAFDKQASSKDITLNEKLSSFIFPAITAPTIPAREKVLKLPNPIIRLCRKTELPA